MEPMPAPWVDALLHAHATHDRINRYLLERLDAELWNARPGTGRTVAGIVAHMHNVRVMWLKATRAQPLPDPVDRASLTRSGALSALDASGAAVRRVLGAALAGTGKVRGAPPDAAHFLAYQIAHDAHHRGQICMLARQLGHPLSKAAEVGMWEYRSRAKDVGVDTESRPT